MIRLALIAAASASVAIGSPLAEFSALSPDPAGFDRAALMQETQSLGFAAAEEKYLAAAAAGDAADALRLARFYAANALWIEALARIADDPSPPAARLAAECDFRLGRYRRVVARLMQTAPGDPLLAISYARLGAYQEAQKAFASAPFPDARSNLTEEFQLAKAETLAAVGFAEDAAEVLTHAGAGEANARRRNYLAGKISAARGDRIRAAAALRRASGGEQNEWSMRARLALAEDAGDVTAVEKLSLEWRGGAFERDLQLALGRLRLAGNDYDRGLSALRQVVDRHFESQAALDAQDLIGATLPKILADEAEINPKDAARIFFENVEFAPPGREGDTLIQEAAGKFKALGLYRQAAQLLDHQVFKRLRGFERATVAADLAELHLLDKNPPEALRVIRSTRIAGLSDEINARRRRIEARSLAAAGKAEGAISLLSDAPDAEDILLKAEINWSRRYWQEAARDYASYVSTLASMRVASDRAAAVRAATAFLLAGDRQGYRAFAVEIGQRLEGMPEANLIRTLGDVDQGQFLAKMMDSYRAVYAEGRP